MRVAIDVTAALTQRAGVGRYTRELVNAFAAMASGPDLRPFFVAPHADYPLDVQLPMISRRRSIRSWRLEVLARHLLQRAARGPWDQADLYHAPDIVYPPVNEVPVVMTVHDLSFKIHAQHHTRLNATYLTLLTPLAARRARLIIADSMSTKHDLVRHAGVPGHKIRVVYPGVASIFTQTLSPEGVAQVRQRYGLTDPFILSVGTQEPRKNLFGTLSAYRLLRQRVNNPPQLALVGGTGWGLHEDQLITPADAQYVHRLGFVPDADLAVLYAACSAFVYPSFYEGWGLPVAEAMAQGAPTVTSNLSSLPEVAGDSALLVNPQHPEEIADALARILGDSALAACLRAEGPIRARQFSRERWASETLQVYQEALDPSASLVPAL